MLISVRANTSPSTTDERNVDPMDNAAELFQGTMTNIIDADNITEKTINDVFRSGGKERKRSAEEYKQPVESTLY